MSIHALLGWAGMILFVLAYLLLSLKYFSSDSIAYHSMNMLGGLFLSIYSIIHDDIPNFSVNFIWMGIALYSIGRIIHSTLLKGRKIEG